MASSNINKIVCGNLNLKPWILSKAPTDIVNNYVQRLYKEIPYNFRTDLLRPRAACASQTAPCPPLRSMHTAQLARLAIPIVAQPKPKLRSNGYCSPPVTAKSSYIHAKKLLKTSPNFRIYNTRRHASSVSSSNTSFNLGHFEEYRRKIYKPAIGIHERSYSGAPGLSSTAAGSIPGIAKYVAPTRLFNEINDQLKTLEVTKTICNNLMPVDKMVRNKIRVVRPKAMVREAPIRSGSDTIRTSLKGLNKPAFTRLELFKNSPMIGTSKSVRRESFALSATEYLTSSYGIEEISTRRENARFQTRLIPTYYGATPQHYKVRKESESEKSPQIQINHQEKSEYEDVMQPKQRSQSARGADESERKYTRLDGGPGLRRMESREDIRHTRSAGSPDKKKNDKVKTYGQSPNDFVCRSRRPRMARGSKELRQIRQARELRDIRESLSHEEDDTPPTTESHETQEHPESFSFQPKAKRNQAKDSSKYNVGIDGPRPSSFEAPQVPIESTSKSVKPDSFDVFKRRVSSTKREYSYVPLRDIAQLPRRFF